MPKFLKNKNITVYGIDDFSTGYKSNVPKNVKFIRGDLSDKKILKKLNFKCDYIFHFAGQSSGEKSFDDPIKDIKNNSFEYNKYFKLRKKKTYKENIYTQAQCLFMETAKQGILRKILN